MQTDLQLIEKIQAGDIEAFSELARRYKQLIDMKVQGFPVSDRDDFIQEGYLGLFLAAKSYKKEKGAAFSTYAGVCIQNQILSAIRRVQSKKNLPLNTATKLDEDLEDFRSLGGNPQDLMELRGNYSQLIKDIRNTLTKLEYEVLLMYLNGVKRGEIKGEYGITLKAYDNALLRIRRKLSKFKG